MAKTTFAIKSKRTHWPSVAFQNKMIRVINTIKILLKQFIDRFVYEIVEIIKQIAIGNRDKKRKRMLCDLFYVT